jgi:ABC-2 type transport system permease protein
MALAGTDAAHYVHFLKAAEDYRYHLAQHLNHLQTTKLKYHDKETRLNNNYWKNYPAFSYREPSVGWALSSHWVSVVALLLWGGLLYLFFTRLITRYFTL